MVQTVGSQIIPAGGKKIIFEKPLVLHRIFFSITTLAPPEMWAESRISFDDPMFYSYYTLAGFSKHFEAKGEEIFQGNVWAHNMSGGDLTYDITEILV